MVRVNVRSGESAHPCKLTVWGSPARAPLPGGASAAPWGLLVAASCLRDLGGSSGASVAAFYLLENTHSA